VNVLKLLKQLQFFCASASGGFWNTV